MSFQNELRIKVFMGCSPRALGSVLSKAGGNTQQRPLLCYCSMSPASFVLNCWPGQGQLSPGIPPMPWVTLGKGHRARSGGREAGSGTPHTLRPGFVVYLSLALSTQENFFRPGLCQLWLRGNDGQQEQ